MKKNVVISVAFGNYNGSRRRKAIRNYPCAMLLLAPPLTVPRKIGGADPGQQSVGGAKRRAEQKRSPQMKTFICGDLA